MSKKITEYTAVTQPFIPTDLVDISKHVTQTSGVLIVGKEYTILDFNTGDNFSNVANVISGTINTTGCVFTATGTTPTTYSNGSTLAYYVSQKGTHEQLQESFGGIRNKKVSLTAAQIKALPTTSITLISAIGVGYVIEVISAIVRLNYGTEAFNQDNDLQIRTDNITGDNSFITPGFLDLTSDAILSFQPAMGYAPNYVDNNEVKVRKGGVDSTTGDGTIDIYITYRIITL
jgi:hypothetical protein